MKRLAPLLLLAACSLQTTLETRRGGGAAPTATSRSPTDSPSASVPPAAAAGGVAAWQLEPETDATWNADWKEPGSAPGPRPFGKALCDAAHNHCLHGNTWMMVDHAFRTPDHAHALCYRFQDRFWSWEGGTCDTATAYRTRSATAGTLRVGEHVFVLDGPLPETASNARRAYKWRRVEVATIDAAAGTFQANGHAAPYPIGLARVVVEQVDWTLR